jgi:hypothetical protein
VRRCTQRMRTLTSRSAAHLRTFIASGSGSSRPRWISAAEPLTGVRSSRPRCRGPFRMSGAPRQPLNEGDGAHGGRRSGQRAPRRRLERAGA